MYKKTTMLVIFSVLFITTCQVKENIINDNLSYIELVYENLVTEKVQEFENKTHILKTSQYEDIPYINNETFEILRKFYSNLNFAPEFERGNLDLHDFYKKQFLRLINLEVPFFDRNTQKEFYLNEFGEMNYSLGNVLTFAGGMSDVFNPKDFMYLFFDMNGDGTPELGITNGSRFTYIFQYDYELDKFILWYELVPGARLIMGTRTIREGGTSSPIRISLILLGESGEIEATVKTYSASFRLRDGEEGTIFLVSFPEFVNRNIKITSYIKNQSVIDECETMIFQNEFIRYFRVNADQFNELTYNFTKRPL